MEYSELMSVWTLKMAYERELSRLQDLRYLAQSTTPPLDGMPHAPAHASKIESLATLIVDSQRILVDLALAIEQGKRQLFVALNSIEMKPLTQSVLNRRYVGCESFNSIAKELNYSRRQILRVHDEGLRVLGLEAATMMRFRASTGRTKVVRESPQTPDNATL